jgi:putative membrane protein
MKPIHSLIPFIASLAVTCAVSHSFAADAAVNSKDKSFITNAYEDGLAEVNLGNLGKGKTAHPDVKAFAEHMVMEHSKANSELKTLADSKKVEVATEPTLVAKGKAKLLDAKSGAAFDKAYSEGMVSDHKKAVEAFEKAANEATDPDVKAFAAKTLPTLKEHLSMAEALHDKVGK